RERNFRTTCDNGRCSSSSTSRRSCSTTSRESCTNPCRRRCCSPGRSTSLSADPPEANVPVGGDLSTHLLRNPSGVRLAFKVKSTNNNTYRLKPVYGFVDAVGSSSIEITRTAGPPKEDKLVIQFKEAASDAADAAAIFREGAPLGDVPLPLRAT
ncbi:unnamed protein product, partial [Anisakis simplex]|uniref:Major sperm protein n=1 Tax=Anisakis simplex TaxID=6269 RepID=A0A0M3JCP7_ANISI